jgi:NAD(P)-dependent dehydrogenase (short-subunit alcohol dehydrogenase family)
VLEKLSAEGAEIWHLSRRERLPKDKVGVRHRPFNALTDAIPGDFLPERLDGLVYCPGSIRLRPFARLIEDDFLADFKLNALGAVKVVQNCLPALKMAESGASIVLFSTVAVKTGMPFHASVGAAKGAIEGLTRSLAAELAPHIRVNALAPSLTDTPLSGVLLADDTKRKAAADRHPLRRIGTPEDIAAAVLFLLGKSSSWITGQVVRVDGGMGSTRVFR